MRELYTGIKVEYPSIRVVEMDEEMDEQRASAMIEKLEEISNMLNSQDNREAYIQALVE